MSRKWNLALHLVAIASSLCAPAAKTDAFSIGSKWWETRRNPQQHSLRLLQVATERKVELEKVRTKGPSDRQPLLLLKPLLRQYQERSAPIALSFVPNEFNPHAVLRNPHLQTIGAYFLRSEPNCAYVTDGGILGLCNVLHSAWQVFMRPACKTTACRYWDARERIHTPDGDFFDVDYKYAALASKGTVIVLHGLESNSNTTLSTGVANAHHRNGFDVACINMRGQSGEPNRQLGGYHLGFTRDLKQYLGILRKRSIFPNNQSTCRVFRWEPTSSSKHWESWERPLLTTTTFEERPYRTLRTTLSSTINALSRQASIVGCTVAAFNGP